MKEKLLFEAFYPDPPERVWRALTESQALARWLMPGSFKPQIGFRFRFDGPGRGANRSVVGEVFEVDSAKKLSYTWDDGEDDAPGVVSWTLRPRDGGTHLTLEHTPADAVQPYVLIEASANWRHALYASLPILMRLLGDEERRPRVPIVYVVEEPEPEEQPKRRAGFRQEDAPCRS